MDATSLRLQAVVRGVRAQGAACVERMRQTAARVRRQVDEHDDDSAEVGRERSHEEAQGFDHPAEAPMTTRFAFAMVVDLGWLGPRGVAPMRWTDDHALMQQLLDWERSGRFSPEVVQQARSLARRGAHLLSAGCVVFLRDPADDTLVVIGAEHAEGTRADALVSSPLVHRIAAEVARASVGVRARVVCARAGSATPGVEVEVDDVVARHGVAAMLVVRLRGEDDDGPAIGALLFFREHESAALAADLSLAVSLADASGRPIARAIHASHPGGARLAVEPRLGVQHVAAALLRAGSRAEVAEALVASGGALADAEGAAVLSWSRAGRVVVLAARGIDQKALAEVFSNVDGPPESATASSFEVVARADGTTWIIVPLRAGGGPRALFVLAVRDVSGIETGRRHLIRATARQGALALERAAHRDAERAAVARLQLVSVASARLASSIDWNRTLANVAEVLVPEVARACAVDLVSGGGRDRVLEHPAAPIGDVRTIPLEVRGVRLGELHLELEPDRDGDDDDALLARELGRRVAMALDAARLHRDLALALRAREDFLAAAAHELKTPLTTLEMWAYGVERFGAHAPIDDAAAARQIHRLRELVEQLLDVSRVSMGGLRLEREATDLVALAREITSSLPQLRVELVAPENAVGRWDRFRVGQVLTNLLSNAAKFGGDAPVRLEISAADAMTVVRVRDRGIGIAADDRERIFERFERAVSSRSISGLGLGLWICRAIVRAHGGEISVQSEPGQGSEFTVALPR